MKKLVAIIFIALLCTVVWAGMQKTIYTQYDIIVLQPDSLMRFKADVEVWGNLWLVSTDTTDTANMTPDIFTIDSITVKILTSDKAISDTILFTNGTVILNTHTDSFQITETIINMIGDILLDDVTIDSTLTVVGKAMFNDTVMLGDSADKIILPKGSAIEFYDTTDANKMSIYNTGNEFQFISTKPIKLGTGNVWFGAGDTLYLVDGTGADSNWIVNNGTEVKFAGDNPFQYNQSLVCAGDLDGTNDAANFNWHGYNILLDSDNDAAKAYIQFHGEDSLVVDTSDHVLEWTGSGGIKADSLFGDGSQLTGISTAMSGSDIVDSLNTATRTITQNWEWDGGNLIVADGQKTVTTDGTEADSFSLFDNGVNAVLECDNPFMIKGNYVRIGDAGTVNQADGDGDLYVEDEIECDGAFVGMSTGYFNNTLEVVAGIKSASFYNKTNSDVNFAQIETDEQMRVGTANTTTGLWISAGGYDYADTTTGVHLTNTDCHIKGVTLTGNSLIRGKNEFGDAKTADTVLITGATVADLYWVAAYDSLPAGRWTTVAKVGTLIVKSSAAEDDTPYFWLRIK